MPRRTTAIAAVVALAALAFPSALSAAKPKRILFRATLTANVSASLAYGTQETADGCTYETTAGGSVAVALASARPTTVAAVTAAGRLRLVGTLRSLTARPSYGFVNTHRRPVACMDPPPSAYAGLVHCDPAVPLPVRNLSAAFTAEKGRVTFAHAAHHLLTGRVRSCEGPDPDVGRGGLELAAGSFSPSRLREPSVRRVVVSGVFQASDPLAPPYTGTLERRVAWTLTLTRVTRR